MTSDKGSRTETEVDPAQAVLAKRLANDLIDCDTSILSLIVVDAVGRVLEVRRSARLPDSEQVNSGLVQVFGAIAKMMVGAANNAAPVMGSTEAVVGIFKNQKVLLLNLQEYNLLLALRLSRSANAEYVSDKIRDLLATQAEP